ncbi:Protein FDD123 [Lachnellula hyalina]|uniref:Protein FDD123 n=1 Tax=Lachnellula hyalina TaxID=1316788 RepID=A0A8H8R4X1_9HELO|nr:Protein FDD123 [Lachnellula hyalina]TVY28484.1 Protein FDD123 [Lachnellula hyalina]
MSILLQRSNDALKINPPVGGHHFTVSGSDWLWTVTAIYLFALLLVVGHSYVARSGEKIFHYLFTISLFVGAVAYFTMASDLGSTPIATSTGDSGTRQIFYAKYINWFVGWAPILIAVGLVSGVSWATIIYNIGLSWVWIASWLSGALVATHYKWGFYAFGVFAYFLLVSSLLYTGSITARRLQIKSSYLLLSSWLTFIWVLYAIAYGLDDGGNEISVTSGFIFFGILDVLNVPVIACTVLFLSRNWDYRSLNLYFTQYGRVAQGGEFPEREKGVVEPVSTTAPAPAPAAASAPGETV